MTAHQRLLAIMTAMLAAGLAAAALPASRADPYPSRTVHLVVPYAAGGTGDIVARVIADKLAGALGQSVVVENRPGASGALGTRASSPPCPDGHTLLVGQTGGNRDQSALEQRPRLRPGEGFGAGRACDHRAARVGRARQGPLFGSVAEMLKAASERGLVFASSGTATPGHFAGEVLKLKTTEQAHPRALQRRRPGLERSPRARMWTCSSPAFRPPSRT